MKLLLQILIFSCITYTFGYAQDSTFVVTGKVIDSETKFSLKNVSVQNSNTLNGTLTDSLGNFKLSIRYKNNQLLISRVGYESFYLNVSSSNSKKITVELKQKLNLLKEVVINSSPIEIVAQSKTSNILDYGFIDGNIILITYRNNLAKSKLVLLNSNLDTLHIIYIPEEPIELFTDCFGDNHIVCENNTYQIYTIENKLNLLPASSITDFKTILAPCMASDSLNLYFQKKYGSKPIEGDFHTFNSNNLNARYYYVNKLEKKMHYLATISDDFVTKMSNDEERFEASQSNAGLKNTGERLFAERILFKEIEAPLYKIKHKIYIFDYVSGNIHGFNQGKYINSIPITFHKTLKWKREMFVDEKIGSAYAHFVTNGISEIREISLTTGKLEGTTKIPFPFVKKIKAQNNYFYFLYKGKEYDDTRYLSRIKINR